MLFIERSVYQSILKKCITVFHKNIKQKNWYTEQQISIEWFLKDNVALKTVVMATEHSALPSKE